MVGEIKIKGSIDATMIERGFDKIKKGFERVKSKTKSFSADMVRIGKETSNAAKSLSLISTVGLAAMTGLAKSAPAVAPAMAKIGIQAERLSRIMGTQLKPFFDKFAESFVKFTNFVDAHPNVTKGFAIGATGIAGVTALTKLVNALKGAASSSMLQALGIVGGAAFIGKKAAEIAEPIAEKSRGFLYEQAAEVPGSIAGASRDAEFRAQLKKQVEEEGPLNTPDGAIRPWTEGSRRAFLLRWWDALWS